MQLKTPVKVSNYNSNASKKSSVKSSMNSSMDSISKEKEAAFYAKLDNSSPTKEDTGPEIP